MYTIKKRSFAKALFQLCKTQFSSAYYFLHVYLNKINAGSESCPRSHKPLENERAETTPKYVANR